MNGFSPCWTKNDLMLRLFESSLEYLHFVIEQIDMFSYETIPSKSQGETKHKDQIALLDIDGRL